MAKKVSDSQVAGIKAHAEAKNKETGRIYRRSFFGGAGICGIFDRNRSECRRLPEEQRGTVLQKKGFSGGTDLCQRCLHEYDGGEKAVSVFE